MDNFPRYKNAEYDSDSISMAQLYKPNQTNHLFAPVTAATLLSSESFLDSPLSANSSNAPYFLDSSRRGSFMGSQYGGSQTSASVASPVDFLFDMDQLTVEDDQNQSQGEFNCPDCNKSFTKLVALRSHETVHKADKKHLCMFCGKPFARRHDMLRHERTVHSSERQFLCGTCNRGFPDVDTLNSHCTSENHVPSDKVPGKSSKKAEVRKKSVKKSGFERKASLSMSSNHNDDAIDPATLLDPNFIDPASYLNSLDSQSTSVNNGSGFSQQNGLNPSVVTDINGSFALPLNFQTQASPLMFTPTTNEFGTTFNTNYQNINQQNFNNPFPNPNQGYSVSPQDPTFAQFNAQVQFNQFGQPQPNTGFFPDMNQVGYQMTTNPMIPQPQPQQSQLQQQMQQTQFAQPQLPQSNRAMNPHSNFQSQHSRLKSSFNIPSGLNIHRPSPLSSQVYSEFDLADMLKTPTGRQDDLFFESAADGLVINDTFTNDGSFQTTYRPIAGQLIMEDFKMDADMM